MKESTYKAIWEKVWSRLEYKKGEERTFDLSYKKVYELTCKQHLKKTPSYTLTPFDRKHIKDLEEGSKEYIELEELYNKNLSIAFDMSGLDELEEELRLLEEELRVLEVKKAPKASVHLSLITNIEVGDKLEVEKTVEKTKDRLKN